jgi:hypothetical protein
MFDPILYLQKRMQWRGKKVVDDPVYELDIIARELAETVIRLKEISDYIGNVKVPQSSDNSE